MQRDEETRSGNDKGSGQPNASEGSTSGALDLQAAYISQSSTEEGRAATDAPSIVLPNQDATYVSHIALDIGGSLVKLVYFSPEARRQGGDNGSASGNQRGAGGKLHFVKFETSQMQQCLDFIQAKGLHHRSGSTDGGSQQPTRVVATGGGAFKFADLFEERLGLALEREDEMDCLVGGCNFLLKAIRHEAFTYESGATNYINANVASDLYPYLLVNIGSGVSMLKVDGDGQSERVSGSSLGGGTFWGLCRLLTRCRGFDEMLELSMRGDNAKVDMLVGDIYGKDRDYSSIGLSASTIASSFGKVVSEGKDLEDIEPADCALALCRMVSYNIGHLAYLNAKRYGLQRVFFGGFFIRGHSYTMETISFAIRFWSKGEMAAMFLRHEGFLGAVGAFLKVHPMTPGALQAATGREPRKVRARFVERFSMGAPYAGGEVHGPAFNDMAEKVSWVEKFVQVGSQAAAAARSEHDRASSQGAWPLQRGRSDSIGHAEGDAEVPSSPVSLRMNLHVGVLHYNPLCEPFPLLEDPTGYEPNTFDIHKDPAELSYWIGVLEDQIRTAVEKAISSSGDRSKDAPRRAAAFGRAMQAHFGKLHAEPTAYGRAGLAELLEMREECLREFGFDDVYRLDKQRENEAALIVLPDLLAELDRLAPHARLLALVQGALAGNIFDWGAKATVELYHDGTILEIYRRACTQLSKRPWRVDDFDALAGRWFSRAGVTGQTGTGVPETPFRRVIMFVDNAGADIILGMLPLTRELLRMGAEVVLVGNSLPAINDVTAAELQQIVQQACLACSTMKAAREAALLAKQNNGGRIPPYPGLCQRVPSHTRLSELSAGSGSPGGGAAPPPQGRKASAEGAALEGERQSPAAARFNPLREPKLYIVSNGQGSPCLDLRRVPDALADATIGADLVVIEGMGRAVHTNLHARLKCDTLKLAMIKNQHVAEKLFDGNVYDCICKFEPARTPIHRTCT